MELVLLMVVGRLLGELLQRIGQPPLMGQLLAGLILGPSIFGLVWPAAQHAIFPTDPTQKSMIDAVSQLGVLLLLMLTGMETDLKLVKKVGPAALISSIAGVAVPFACGFTLGEFLPASILPEGHRLVPSLFIGTALAISSVKIVALVVRDMNFMRRNLGQIIVASAIIEDAQGSSRRCTSRKAPGSRKASCRSAARFPALLRLRASPASRHGPSHRAVRRCDCRFSPARFRPRPPARRP